MKPYIVSMVVSLQAALLGGQSAHAKPVFVGVSSTVNACYERKETLSLSYMTADQMAYKVQSLTGFYQPGFDEYGSIIGKYDARTGARTNDRPSIMSVMIMEQLLGEVAQSVLQREEFLDDEDRIVFRGIAIAESPEDSLLAHFVSELCSAWLVQGCPADIELNLNTEFRTAESSEGGVRKAWTQLVSGLLQNGSIYFY